MPAPPVDPDGPARARDSFARQSFLRLLGADITDIAPGRCEITMPVRPDLCQHHGFVHAGVTTTLADTAGGFAAQTLMPPGSSVLTVELKINLIAPARGERLIARAQVERAGRSLTVVRAEVLALADGRETAIALMQGTMMSMSGVAQTPAGA